MIRTPAIVLNVLLLGCAAVILLPFLMGGTPAYIVLCVLLVFLAPAASLIVLLLPLR